MDHQPAPVFAGERVGCVDCRVVCLWFRHSPTWRTTSISGHENEDLHGSGSQIITDHYGRLVATTDGGRHPLDESWGCATEADIELVDNNLYVQVSINRFFEVEINSTNQRAVVTRRLQGGGTLGNELYIWWSPFTVNDHLSITTDGGDNGDLGGHPGRLNRRRLAESVTTTTTTVPPTTTTTTNTVPPTTTTTTTTTVPPTTTTTSTVPVPSLPVVSRLPAWDNGSYRPVTYSNIPSVPSSCTPWVYWRIRPGMTRLIALCPR